MILHFHFIFFYLHFFCQTLPIIAHSITEIVEWECFCYNTKDECRHDQNGTALVKFQVLLDDKSCRSINLNCYNRQLRSWRQGTGSTNGLLVFHPTEYCADGNNPEWMVYSDCSSQYSNDHMGRIGCYAVNNPGSSSCAISQTNMFFYFSLFLVINGIKHF